MSPPANPSPEEISRRHPPETGAAGRPADIGAPGRAEESGAAGHPADIGAASHPADIGAAGRPADGRAPAGLRRSPPPLEVDTFALVMIGEALWLIAFLVLLFFRDGHGLWLQTCAAGFLLGLLGAFLSRTRRG